MDLISFGEKYLKILIFKGRKRFLGPEKKANMTRMNIPRIV